MEYVNPVSIAGMAQGPQGQMLPGTGAGPLDMYQRNQALGQAYDFLDMSKAAGAQDYVNQQWKMQTAHDSYGLDKAAKGLANETARQGIETSKMGNQLSEEKLKMLRQGNRIQALQYVGSLSEPLSQTKDPMAASALMSQARQNYAQMFPDDQEGLQFFDSFDGSPQSMQRTLAATQNARHIATYADQAFRQKMALQGDQQGFESRERGLDRKSRKEMNDADNATQLKIAELREAGRKAVEGGGNAWSQFRADVGRAMMSAVAKQKQNQPLSPNESAALQVGAEILTGGVVSTRDKMDPTNVESAARAKVRGEVGELLDIVKPGGNQKPAVPNTAPQQQDQVSGQPDFANDPVFKDRLKEMGWDYEPDKYEYFKDHVGQYFRRKK